ncbi:MAG: MBL fold metallo-hydrolase [Calditrichaeota bacterium]|nr:MBL fold metallo-hydrolase [Calditrichota bacterium]
MTKFKLIFILLLLFDVLVVQAQDNAQSQITVRVRQIKQTLYMLDGVGGFGGGNVTASIGDDGILLADDMYQFMVPKIEAELKKITDKPIRIVVNSHVHGDHIQGNSQLRDRAIIIAHRAVAEYLEQNHSDARPTRQALPHLRFDDKMTIEFNGEMIDLIHYPDSHSNGDLAIYFRKSGVLHLGDLYFQGMFPGVYKKTGGNLKGLIKAIETIIADYPADTQIVPGHGELSTMSDLANYLEMLKESTSIVETGINQGKSLEKLIEEKVLSKYDQLGSGGGQSTDQYLTMLYHLLKD